MNRLAVKLAITIRGHIFNPPWKSRLERRRHRGEMTSKYVCRYLNRYLSSFVDIEDDSTALASMSDGNCWIHLLILLLTALYTTYEVIRIRSRKKLIDKYHADKAERL